MYITDIVQHNKNKYKIYVDYEFAFVLYKGELRQYHLREGETIREEDYREIMEEVLPKRAKLYCMNLLQSREYTESQLRAKLTQGLYPKEIIDQAIAYISSYHYIDDLRYAEDYITTHENTRQNPHQQNHTLGGGAGKPQLGHTVAYAADHQRLPGGNGTVEFSPEGRKQEIGKLHGGQHQTEHIIRQFQILDDGRCHRMGKIGSQIKEDHGRKKE